MEATPDVLAAYETDQGGSGRDYKRDGKGTPTGGQFAKDPKSATKPTKHQPAKVPHHAPTKHAPAKKAAPAAKTTGDTKRRYQSLKSGNTGPAVAQLQALMVELKIGSNRAIDGRFGADTERAVKEAQTRLGLKPTGRASAALVRRLHDAHTLSPCVPKSGSRVAAAAGEYSTDYEADVVDRVEVAPDTWVCAHDDGSVSLKLRLDPESAREWADAFTEMADGAEAAEGEGPEAVEEPEPVQAAAGMDVTPGHDELHHYWTKGEGLAKWAESPTPWTTLVAHLTKHVGPAKAKVFASRWFIEVFGYAAGSDKNRVAHGHKPRGEKVGPG